MYVCSFPAFPIHPHPVCERPFGNSRVNSTGKLTLGVHLAERRRRTTMGERDLSSWKTPQQKWPSRRDLVRRAAGKTAPIALFIFNRPELTARVYACIRAARPERLFIVADGPRATRPDDKRLCDETRRVVASPDWPCEIHVNFASDNLACRRRISSGLDWVFQQSPEAIILEDDCVPCASFFEFCSEMLHYYRDDKRIVHISGDNFQDGKWRGSGSYYFSRYPHTWGWATWRRAWQAYDVNISSWPAAYRARWLDSVFDNPREARYWESVFDRVYRGQVDAWDY